MNSVQITQTLTLTLTITLSLALSRRQAGLEVRGSEFQSMQHPSASIFIGSGKLDELKDVRSRDSKRDTGVKRKEKKGRRVKRVPVDAAPERKYLD